MAQAFDQVGVTCSTVWPFDESKDSCVVVNPAKDLDASETSIASTFGESWWWIRGVAKACSMAGMVLESV
jgi:hypothetical protein